MRSPSRARAHDARPPQALGRWPAHVLVALPLVAPAGDPGFRFVDVAAERGIEPLHQAEGMGTGVAVADYEDDGDLDLFVPNGSGHPDQLYRNAAGVFDEIGARVRVASLQNSRAALWLDYDGDRDLDLVVARDSFFAMAPPPPNTLGLYRQAEDRGFDDATGHSGLAGDLLAGPGTHIGGLAAGDIDRDGDLDLCLAQWEGELVLFRNDDGLFADVSDSSGVGGVLSTHWQPVFHDFDGDGWQDLFVAKDFVENRLWVNERDGTFADHAADAGVDRAWNEMGAALGDVDADGDQDLYVTNVFEVIDGEQRHNTLYENLTRGPALPFTGLAGAGGAHDPSWAARPSFAEIAQQAGVDDGQWGWGTTFLDANRDGWLDLAATNGTEGPPWEDDRSSFFLHRGSLPVAFDDVSHAVGFDDTFVAGALVAGDLDRDGRLDLVQTCRATSDEAADHLRLLENQPTADDGAHYLVVRPRSKGPNTRAIGAVVRVTAGEHTMTRPISAGTSFLGQEPAEAYFAWRGSSVVDALVVEWPGGSSTTWTGVAGDRVVTVVR